MACLWCQKLFEDHTKEEIIICAKWIQEQLDNIAQNHRNFYEKINSDIQHLKKLQGIGKDTFGETFWKPEIRLLESIIVK